MEKNNVAVTCLKQIPALFKKIPWEFGKFNLDIGGGKYDLGTEYLKEKFHVSSVVYDPFNRPAAENEVILNQIFDPHCLRWSTVTIANVLNVIEDEDDRAQILRIAHQALCSGGKVYISIYEGDKSGVGKVTSTGSYQRNLKTREYLKEVLEYFSSAYIENGMIIGIKEYVENKEVADPYAVLPVPFLKELSKSSDRSFVLKAEAELEKRGYPGVPKPILVDYTLGVPSTVVFCVKATDKNEAAAIISEGIEEMKDEHGFIVWQHPDPRVREAVIEIGSVHENDIEKH